MIVDAARGSGRHHFGLVESGQVRNAQQLLRIAAGDARGGDVLETGGATGRDHAPLGAGQLRQAPADPFGQLVELHEMLRRGVHCGPHLRQFHAMRR